MVFEARQLSVTPLKVETSGVEELFPATSTFLRRRALRVERDSQTRPLAFGDTGGDMEPIPALAVSDGFILI